MHFQHGWQPIEELLCELRSRFGHLALFFYNQYTPEIICILWRPTAFDHKPFSAKTSVNKRPLTLSQWRKDSLIISNFEEIMQEIEYLSRDIIVGIKVQNDNFMQPRDCVKKQKVDSSSGSEEASSEED